MIDFKQFGLVVTGFLAGFASYEAIIRVANLDRVPHGTYKTDDEVRRDYTLNSEVAANYVAKSAVQHDSTTKPPKGESSPSKPHFVPGEWRYQSMSRVGGDQVAQRLSDLGASPENVVVAYDGSGNDTFHIWYRDRPSGTKYAYRSAGSKELSTTPMTNFFLADGSIVPAGIGTSGGLGVPIYFQVSK